MSKHTPGPWWITESGVRDAGGYICHTNQPTHYPGQDERYASEVAERKANKALISAAPDLFESLQALELLFSPLAKDSTQAVWVDKARAALAKATVDPAP